MVLYQSRFRKRIRAIRRAPDGSAFQTCDKCGLSVAIALVDMHDCQLKKDVNVKRFKGDQGRRAQLKIITSTKEQRFEDQPRSGFRFFMESFMKTCEAGDDIDLDQKGFDTWRSMSQKERYPFDLQAKKVSNAYEQALLKEEEEMSMFDDEANSAVVGKFDEKYEAYEYYDDSDYSLGSGNQSDVIAGGIGLGNMFTAPSWYI